MSRRVRKHVNPFQVLTYLGHLEPSTLFGRQAALEVEFGSGAGGFLLERATQHPERDFIGLEVRKPLVIAAEDRRLQQNLHNLRYFYASAQTNARFLPPCSVDVFHIHFPDPCFKKRHWKRRLVQPALLRAMAETLKPGGQLYMQSDVLPLAEEMLAFALAETAFENLWGEQLEHDRAFAQATEWERHHEAVHEPIYRMFLQKIREPEGPIPQLEFREIRPNIKPEALRPPTEKFRSG